MQNSWFVNIVQASYNLVEEELNVIVTQILGRFYYSSKVSLHQVCHDVSLKLNNDYSIIILENNEI